MTKRWRERMVDLAERLESLTDHELRKHRGGHWSDPEPFGWISGARDGSRFCAEELRRALEELSVEERKAIREAPAAMSGAAWGALELREDAEGRSHYLAGRAVCPGDQLELLMPGGYVLRGRYAWDTDQGERFDRAPVLVAEIPASGAADAEAFLSLPPAARLRWPE